MLKDRQEKREEKRQEKRRKADSEYHTGRLNISCPPSKKDSIAADATAQGQSISQYMMSLYDKSHEAGGSEHLARMGLELVGIKKKMVDIDARLTRTLQRSGGTIDARTAEELARMRETNTQIDATLREILDAVKELKSQGK